jgi:hypothetical protein
MSTRNELLESLLCLARPTPEIVSDLASYGWDSEDRLVTLTRAHVVAVLRRFLSGDLAQDQVEEWANAVESREDIAIETAAERLLRDAIFELANPVLTRELTADLAADWIAALESEFAE